MVRKVAGAVLQENESSNLESRLEKATVDESILLMKFYSLTSGIARQLLTAGNGSKMELLFEVNDEEAAIIQYPFSTFILGRSGTGKTTVITTRLLKLEQRHKLVVDSLANKSEEEDDVNVERATASQASETFAQSSRTDYLRQVMVTLSPKLCAAIKHHIAKTSRTMLAEDSTTTTDNDEDEDVMLDEEEEMKLMGGIPDTLVNISPSSFPLVITFRKFLAMVDGSVSCPFFEQEDSQLYGSLVEGRFGESGIPVSDAEEEHECDGFSELDQEEGTGDRNHRDKDEDEDSDDFSSDEDLATGEDDSMTEKFRRKQSNNTGKMKKRMTEVTFEHFVSFYWPHFSQDLIKHFDSSVVFTEIMSFIKGSLEALHTQSGRLTREEYLSLAVKRTSTFDERQRNSIYNIFQLYEKRKAVRNEYDIADCCSHLYAQMRLGNYVGLKFHYVYVDEVQDLTMAQIALFKYVCSNIAEGYVFAGDTAQTIARGVSFRFQDIRHLFYKEFLERGDSSLETSHRTGQRALEDNYEKPFDQTSSKRGKGAAEKPPHMPELHHLSHNFRTHVGIVNMANSIVQLLYNFFPNTVDKLNPESSLIQGETPIFLEREDNHEFVTSLFGHGGVAGGGGCDFGAEQVILVRDLATKHHITEKLGKRGLVMTVLECKGLEFQDVLLYNFFSDSLFGRNWRVIYSYMADNSTLENQNGRTMSFPQFDVQKHNLLMSELKQLYVVVTRARQRLWIYDECPEHHRPMLDFWNHSGLIQVKRLDEDLIQTIHGKSTPEDWKRRGIQMFNDHHYDMAQLSFERAGDLHRANWAKAAGLQQAGERLLGSDAKASAQLFREAATLFLSLGKGESAAKCYLKIGDNKKAGIIFRDSCKPPRLEDAGDCFMDAKCWTEAADAYNKSFCVRQCLLACLKGKLLDLGADFLDDWEQQLNSRDQERLEDAITLQPVSGDELEQLKLDYLKKCALHYHKQRNTESMMKFVRRFPSVTSQKVFLKRRDYFDQLIEVEEGEGNFLRAAEMAEQKGDLKHAVKLLVRGGCHEEAVGKLLDRARFEMLWSDGKQGWPLIATSESQDLLQRVSEIISSCRNDIGSNFLQELQLLVDSSSGLQHWEQLKDSTDIRFQLIAGRQAIDELQVKSTKNVNLTAMVPDVLQIWDLWSQKLILLIQAIDRAQRRRDTVEDEVFLHSSNTYLGVEKHAQPHLFLVADASSSWLKNSPITRLPNQGLRGQVSSSQLFSLSGTFWATQLWQVGLGVMKLMEGVLFNGSDLKLTMTESTKFSTESFQPRGELLCKLYSITKTLADIMSKNTIQDEYQDLQNRLERYGSIIFDASFPHGCSNESWNNVLTFRQEVGAIYDSIATKFVEPYLGQVSQSPLPEIRFATVGSIQMLLPFLSRQWIRKYGHEIQGKLRQPEWSSMWEKALRMYSNPSEDSWQSPENKCANWVDTTEVYCGSLQNVYKEYRSNIGPFVFMQLLERDRNLVDKSGIDWRVSLPSLIFRMLVSVLTICVNLKRTAKSSDTEIWSRVITTLKALFRNQPPLLGGLPPKFYSGLRKSFTSQYPLPDDELRVTFKRAMAAVNDPLIVLKHGDRGKKIANWAHRNKVRFMVITRIREMRRVFGVHFETNKKPAWVAKPTVESAGTVPNTDVPKLEPVELHSSVQTDSNIDSHAFDIINTLLSTGPIVALTDDADGQDELEMQEDEQSQDIWVGDESTDDTRLDSRTIPPGHVICGEGQTVLLFVKIRLLQLLEDARQRLKEDLTATERYRRDTRTAFWKLDIKSKEYVEFFLSEACPLKATADEWLQDLEIALQALKDDDTFDEIADFQDALQKVVVVLDPRTEEHVHQDLKVLEEKLTEVRNLLETGKQKYQKQIRMLGIGCKDAQCNGGNILTHTEEGETNTSADQKTVTKSQKSKPQQKKKKKKGKK
ncbi:unnamed protein product [Calypogeia fissa]